MKKTFVEVLPKLLATGKAKPTPVLDVVRTVGEGMPDVKPHQAPPGPALTDVVEAPAQPEVTERDRASCTMARS